MSREPVRYDRQREAIIEFPIGKLSGFLALLVIGGTFVYRLSETGGQSCQAACLYAMGTSFLAAIAALVPICKVWGKELLWVLLGVFLSGIIRLLIALCGAGIIILFTDISRTQYIVFLALYYVAFLVVDTWLALWVLNNVKRHHPEEDEDPEAVIHGNIWDIISRHRKPA